MRRKYKQTSEYEISLFDILMYLCEHWKFILFGGVAGGMLGVAYILTMPDKFQANGVIQMATVAGADIEKSINLIEKLQINSFYDEITSKKCPFTVKDDDNHIISNNLTYSAGKETSLVTLRFVSTDADNATNCLEKLIERISESQHQLAVPLIEEKRNQLIFSLNKKASAENFINKYSLDNINLNVDDLKFSSTALLLSTLLVKNDQLIVLQNEINTILDGLAYPRTKSTSLIAPIFTKKIFNRTKILIVAFSAGIFLAFMLLLGKNFWDKLFLQKNLVDHI